MCLGLSLQVAFFMESMSFLSQVIQSGVSASASLKAFTYGLLSKVTANLNEGAADSVNQ